MVKNKYSKGANAERELFNIILKQEFAVIRVAGSGSVGEVPDLIALGKGKKIAFECKAWNANYLHISNAQMQGLFEWVRKADADLFIAWKIPNRGWLFLQPQYFKKTNKNYAISRATAEKHSIRLDVVLGLQSKLKP